MQHPILRERVIEFFGSNFTVRKAFSSDKYEIVHSIRGIHNIDDGFFKHKDMRCVHQFGST